MRCRTYVTHLCLCIVVTNANVRHLMFKLAQRLWPDQITAVVFVLGLLFLLLCTACEANAQLGFCFELVIGVERDFDKRMCDCVFYECLLQPTGYVCLSWEPARVLSVPYLCFCWRSCWVCMCEFSYCMNMRVIVYLWHTKHKEFIDIQDPSAIK